MQRFIKAFLTFLVMYREGFFFSDNTHASPPGTHWGFYRFNQTHEAALFDIDFSFDKKDHSGYFHCHGDDFRMSIDPKGKRTSRRKK